MKVTTLRRQYFPEGTFGRLYWAGIETPIFTVERPWLSNARDVSCLPEGVYACRPRHYHDGGYPATEVTNVPGRGPILFHRGNWVNETKGCILIGLEPQEAGGKRGVRDSAGAWEIFKAAGFLDEPFILEVTG